MAKKQFTQPDELVSSLDDLGPPKTRSARAQSARTRAKSFTEGLSINARDVATVTGDKTMAGQYKRKQILISPAQLQYVQRKARELRISQAELFRWLIDYGLMALDDGVKPEVEVVDVRSETKKAHWTSQ